MRTIKPTNRNDPQKVIPLEISKILTISTAHVTPKTLSLLDMDFYTQSIGLAVYPKGGFGFFIYLPDSTDLEAVLSEKPEDLKTVLRFCHDVGCNILCLDSDGPHLPYLTSYDNLYFSAAEAGE